MSTTLTGFTFDTAGNALVCTIDFFDADDAIPTGTPVDSTTSNGTTGKWSASLADGSYDVRITSPTGKVAFIKANALLPNILTPDGSQTVQNKSLDNTNDITVKDDNLTLQDGTDTSKHAKFQLSGITTGTTRTLTLPDADTTLVGTNTIQNTGAWTDFTPGVTQSSALTVSVVFARYAIFGKTAIVQMQISISSAGSAGSAVVVTGIPAAIQPKQTGTEVVCGSAVYLDSGTSYYNGHAIAASSTTMKLLVGERADYLGSSPNIAAASGDKVMVVAVYEIA